MTFLQKTENVAKRWPDCSLIFQQFEIKQALLKKFRQTTKRDDS